MTDSKGREIVWCAAAFISGNAIAGGLWGVPHTGLVARAFALLTAAAPVVFIYSIHKELIRLQWTAILASFALLGAWGLLTERTPPYRGATAIEIYAQKRQSDLSCRLDRLLTGESGNDISDEIAVLKALTIGDKSELTRSIKKNYRASGATHLLALSGLHVGIIYKIFGYLMAIFGGSPLARKARSILTLAFLWWFAVITGLSPSIFRAVLMITIYETGRLLGRRGNGINSLALSAIIIVLLDPEAPRNLSFQMSFCACLSIFTIFPVMKGMMETGFKPLEYVWDCACLAISCQMTTGAIAWLKFGTFPKYFIISNLLTVPLVGVIMYLVAAAILTAPFPSVGNVVVQLLVRTTELLNLITETIAGL